jgi:excisionase family DNA binding protein
LATILLQVAGVADPALTVSEAADLVGVTEETVRSWCRSGALGRFDRRLKLYLIGKGELRAFLLAHWRRLPQRFDSAAAQVPGVVSFGIERINMDNDKPLTPFERSRLETLLAKIGGPSVESVAKSASELSAEQSRLHKEQQRLAEQERRLSAKLQTIRSDLDATTAELMARARRRRANQNLVEYLETIRTQLDAVLARSPDYAGRVDPRELTTLMRALFDDAVDRADAARGRFQELAATPQLTEDDTARLRADEVIRAGEKWSSGVFRDDALSPSGPKRRRRQ